ncbi:MAG TPA: hypothetical protein VK807_00385 [Gemmatimonadaceae bacterium]|jgi:hypothetical protein|nr:hypothetical protein [Gemmatimonadaceae bacterium]
MVAVIGCAGSGTAPKIPSVAITGIPADTTVYSARALRGFGYGVGNVPWAPDGQSLVYDGMSGCYIGQIGDNSPIVVASLGATMISSEVATKSQPATSNTSGSLEAGARSRSAPTRAAWPS